MKVHFGGTANAAPSDRPTVTIVQNATTSLAAAAATTIDARDSEIPEFGLASMQFQESYEVRQFFRGELISEARHSAFA